jgi:hypothetical protein
MSRMTDMRSWKSLRLTSHTWLGLNPQIGKPLSRIVVPLVYFIVRKTFLSNTSNWFSSLLVNFYVPLRREGCLLQMFAQSYL